ATAVDRRDDVAEQDRRPRLTQAAQARALGRRILRDAQHDDADDAGVAEQPPAVVVVGDDAERAERRAYVHALRDQLRHDAVHGVDGHGEADTGIGPGRAVDHRVDADEPAGAVDQR